MARAYDTDRPVPKPFLLPTVCSKEMRIRSTVGFVLAAISIGIVLYRERRQDKVLEP
jgi:hypothetical protein